MNRFFNKKIVRITLVIITVIVLLISILMFAKFIILFSNTDEIIYTHSDAKFIPNIIRISSQNVLQIRIDCHKNTGLLDNHFYDATGTFPLKVDKEFVTIPEKFNLYPSDEFSVKALDKFECKAYGINSVNADFEVCNSCCGPLLLSFDDGRKFIIYKKFKNLYIRDLNSN